MFLDLSAIQPTLSLIKVCHGLVKFSAAEEASCFCIFNKCIGLKAVHFKFTEQIEISWSIFFRCANHVKVTFAGDSATFQKNFGPKYDPPEYDTMYGERCSGRWYYPLGHESGSNFVCEAYCEADGVTVKMEGDKVDSLGLYAI